MAKRNRINEFGLPVRPRMHRRIHEMRKELGYPTKDTKNNQVRESDQLTWDHIKRDLQLLNS